MGRTGVTPVGEPRRRFLLSAIAVDPSHCGLLLRTRGVQFLEKG